MPGDFKWWCLEKREFEKENELNEHVISQSPPCEAVILLGELIFVVFSQKSPQASPKMCNGKSSGKPRFQYSLL